jgi:hypothetical protein
MDSSNEAIEKGMEGYNKIVSEVVDASSRLTTALETAFQDSHAIFRPRLSKGAMMSSQRPCSRSEPSYCGTSWLIVCVFPV